MMKQILQGMVVGIANIIPGVSGGTMMVAMGLYDRLIHAITHLKSEFKESMKLLIPIFAGAGIAIIALSRLFEFLLATWPIPTNFAFCGLIAGSLPFIFKKVKGHKVTVSKIIPFLIFFGVVILMALLGETGGASADVSFGFVNILKLFGVGVIAAATMVVPGVSGSMMLMSLGYYTPIIDHINAFVVALVTLDFETVLYCTAILAPFGVGVAIGIFLISKVVEYLLEHHERITYFAILGLVLASPIAVLSGMNLTAVGVFSILTGALMFGVGAVAAWALGK